MPQPSQATRVLALLQVKPRTAAELEQLAGRMRVNSRVADLRARGFNITCERTKAKGAAGYLYRLVGLDKAAGRADTERENSGPQQARMDAPRPAVLSSPAAVSSPPTVTAARAPRRASVCGDCGEAFWNLARHLEDCTGRLGAAVAASHLPPSTPTRLSPSNAGRTERGGSTVAPSLGGARTDGIGPPAAQLTLEDVA